MIDDYRDPNFTIGATFSGVTHDHMNECIARIENLKLCLIGIHDLPEDGRNDLIAELNILRSAYLHLCTLTASQAVAPQPSREALANAPGPVELEGIVGTNPQILANLERIVQLAPSPLSMLLEGETGCGKEMFARMIHLNSRRRSFVAVNCGALPATLVEAELFGHVRGAFTGSVGDRKGRFEEADGGTIFLDEIGEMDPLAQVKLLRTLDTGEIQRIGSDRPIRVDVRVVSATNRSLERMVAEGRFREDLFYRLSVCHLTIPPLRERRDEIPLLLDYFMEQASATRNGPRPEVAPDLMDFLCAVHPFPGNIRELRNIALYITHIHNGAPVTIDALPDRYRRAFAESRGAAPAVPADKQPVPSRQRVTDDAERNHLSELLFANKGDVQAIAAILHLSRARLYQLFKKHDLSPAHFRSPSRRFKEPAG